MHNNNFHLIRFIAAVLVIYGHTYPLMGLGNLDLIQQWSGGLFPTAHMGVCIFFSISGYLIAQSLLSSSTLAQYSWKRFLRIMPGLVVLALFTILLIGPLATSLSASSYFSHPDTYAYLRIIKIFPSYPDELPGVFKELPVSLVNGSLWTLAYEVTCYFLLMVLFVAFRKYTSYAVLTIFLAAWGSFFLWHELLLNNRSPLRFIHLAPFDLLNFGLYFLVGSLLYFFRQRLPLRGWIALILFGVFMMSYLLSSQFGWIPLMAIGWIRYLFLPYLIIYLGMQPSIWKSFDKLGDLSYGLYIYAFPVQQVLITFFLAKGLSVMSMFGLALALLLPLAWLSWTFIEKPSLKLKNKKLSLSMFLPASKSIRTPLH